MIGSSVLIASTKNEYFETNKITSRSDGRICASNLQVSRWVEVVLGRKLRWTLVYRARMSWKYVASLVADDPHSIAGGKVCASVAKADLTGLS